ncbi:MAG: hypothetical protein ACTSRG_20475 [Candidatus Helarchaeota archaeon]
MGGIVHAVFRGYFNDRGVETWNELLKPTFKIVNIIKNRDYHGY